MQHADAAGWPCVTYEEIDSTNAEALRRAAAGERGPLWITAGVQTHGRGRSGRSWSSASGSVAATLLFSPACAPARLPELALVAGVAAHQAIAAAMPADRRREARLKWPNDVLIGGAKVCGVLIESTLIGDRCAVAIGVGINVASVPRLDGRRVAALAGHGSRTSAADLRQALAGSLGHWLEVWSAGQGLAAVRAAWLERAGPIGEPLSINAGEGPAAGTFAGLDSDGALLLDGAGTGRRRYTFGDVSLDPL